MVDAQEAGRRLEGFLRRMGMQQKELADAVGVEASYISRMVKGHINWTTGKHFGNMAAQLRLSDAEVKEMNPAAVVERAPAHPGELGPVPGVEDEIPAALLEASEMYRAIDPLIGDPQVLLDLARAGFFGGGPETPQDWIRYFNAVREFVGRGRG